MQVDDEDLSKFMVQRPLNKEALSTASRYHTKSSQSELLGFTTKPSTDTGLALKPEANVSVSYLRPDWQKKRQMYNLKEKTLLKIFLSKWYYQGLSYEEKELLLLLCESQGLPTYLLETKIYSEVYETTGERELGEIDRKGIVIKKNNYKITGQAILAINLIGESVLARLSEKEESLYSKGSVCLEWLPILERIYSRQDFSAVWKLRSFQSLRDKIFSSFVRANQTGKTGVKKPRIRGYTDGRGSSGDTRRVKMAREADAWFWQDEYQNSWEQLFHELEIQMKT
jgi:hypothetical protein